MNKDKSPKPRRGSADSATARRPTVRQRAEQIIAAEHIDHDTRAAIKNSLDTNDGDLAELVRRAESGEEIIDITKGISEGGELNAVTFAAEVKTLTHDEARSIATSIVNAIGDEESELSLVLLLCYALVNSDDAQSILIGIEEAIIPSTKPAIIATQREVCSQLAGLRRTA